MLGCIYTLYLTCSVNIWIKKNIMHTYIHNTNINEHYKVEVHYDLISDQYFIYKVFNVFFSLWMWDIGTHYTFYHLACTIMKY